MKPGFEARGWAYFEGGFVPLEQAKISVATHAFNYGTGVFEGIRGYWNADHEQVYVVKLLEHLRRMGRSANMLRITLPKPAEELAEIAVELVRRGEYREDVYIRPIAYKASPIIRVGLIGLQDSYTCFTAPMGAYHDIDRGLARFITKDEGLAEKHDLEDTDVLVARYEALQNRDCKDEEFAHEAMVPCRGGDTGRFGTNWTGGLRAGSAGAWSRLRKKRN